MKDHTRDDMNAWRALARQHMPDWRPTFQQLRQLDEGPHELITALRSITRGWARSDARWDVLMGVLEYYKREHAHKLAEQQRAHFGVGDAPVRAHCDPDCDFCRGVIEAADLIDPKAQRAQTAGDNK